MKIIRQLREIHVESAEIFNRLAKEVNETLKPRVEEQGWFFLSRVKAIESFALKVETGRFQDPGKMEDFFACTIVVPTINHIDAAETLVLSLYDSDSRRPVSDVRTHKPSYSFAFDDLRLYVRRRPLISGKDEDLNTLLFEVQIKTILQHAWSVATHDLIFKTNTASWPRERVAYQVKAMLEHAEVAIAESDQLADARAVAKTDDRTREILRIIDQVNEFWPKDRLPNDVKRLAETIVDLLRACDVQADQLTPILEDEKRRVGLLPAGLSPYSFTVQSLANSASVDFKKKFTRSHLKVRLVIHADMDLPNWLKEGHDRILNLG